MTRKNAKSTKLVVQNAAKTLLANIRFAGIDGPIRTITVTSAIPNEGKSTVALNLAQAIATSGKSVVLVECDMRRQSIATMTGARSQGGIYAVLSNQMTLDEAVAKTSQKNMYVLLAEPHIINPSDVIASKSFARMVKELADKFEYVIFDTPPVGAFVDAAEVGRLSDGVLFVIRENYSKRNEIIEAFDQLKKAEVHIIGAVMNCCEVDTSEHYYAYYSKDGARRTAGNVGVPDVARGDGPSSGAGVGEHVASHATAPVSVAPAGKRFANRK